MHPQAEGAVIMLFETMQFEPRDVNRIQPFCDRLAKAWEKLPDWRFGQMMMVPLWGAYSAGI